MSLLDDGRDQNQVGSRLVKRKILKKKKTIKRKKTITAKSRAQDEERKLEDVNVEGIQQDVSSDKNPNSPQYQSDEDRA